MPNRYLDPEGLARVGNMELVAKQVVEGFITGRHRSPFHGFSAEYLDHRSYTPGDQIDTIDWKLLARTDILVDGPYDRDNPDTERRWIGSTNQRIHFLTARYTFDDQWRKRNTLEIHSFVPSPAMMMKTISRTTPAAIVRPSDWKMAPMGFSLFL